MTKNHMNNNYSLNQTYVCEIKKREIVEAN